MTYKGECSSYNNLLHCFSILLSFLSISFPLIPSTTKNDFSHGRDNSSSNHTQKKPRITTPTTTINNKNKTLPPFSCHKRTFVKARWTYKEDRMLGSFVLETHERPINWSTIAQKIGSGKSANHCHYRWDNHLLPHIKKGAWDEEEDKLLVKYHMLFNNKWTKIAEYIPTRTKVSIQNHFNSSINKLSKVKWNVEPPSVLNNYIRSIMYQRNATSTPSSNSVIAPSASPNSVVFGDVAESSNARRFQNEFSPSNVISLRNEKEDEEMFLNNVCQYVDLMKEDFEWME